MANAPVTSDDFAHGRWRGRWTWLAKDSTDVPDGLFRRSFELAEVPGRVPARLTADTRYRLFVNGVEASAGPIRSQPHRWRYDLIDLAPYLRPGRNVLALQVKHLPGGGAYWMTVPRNETLGGHGVFVFEARVGEVDWLLSDEGWRGYACTAWSDLVGGGLPVEVLDAGLLPPGWTEPGFDDSGWMPADTIRPRHAGASGLDLPPADPYGPLLPNPLSRLQGERTTPARADATMRVGTLDISEPSPVRRLEVAASWPVSGSTLDPTADGPGFDDHALLCVDFGRIVSGRITIGVEAAPGTILDMSFTEDPLAPEVANGFFPQVGARYVCRGYADRFETFFPYGLRYLNVLTTVSSGVAEAVIDVHDIAVHEQLSPLIGEAGFSCSDEVLNAIVTACRRTVELCSHDAFVDCPTREQRAWVGDGVVHQLTHLVCNEDWRLATHYLQLSASPRPDGILPMTVAGDVEAAGGVTIPDWSLHWLHGLFSWYQWSADLSLVRELLPVAQRILAWFVPFRDKAGLLAEVTEWTLVDWSSVTTGGTNAVLTGLWARGLMEFAVLARAVGDPGAAEWADSLHAQAKSGFELFWDEDRGSYTDHAVEGLRQPHMHQLAGAAAIVGDLAPRDRWARIAETITDRELVVRRSWSVGEDDAFEKLQRQLDGERDVDWDVEREIVRAQPFASYLVHDAVARAGRSDLLPALLRDWAEFLEPTPDGRTYDTIGECWGWGTHAHAWSCTPIKDLVMHVLGVTPSAPGCTVVRVAPHLGDLDWAEGRVPTPYGLVWVRADRTQVSMDSPVPVDLQVRDGGVERLSAGRHTRMLA